MKLLQPVYAGIGSRKTPGEILGIMKKLGQALARLGWGLRSGNCKGADQAFQNGANSVSPDLVELYLPWQGYERDFVKPGNAVHTPGRQAYLKAAELHPAWHRCSDSARAMHARNVEIILGPGLVQPVQSLVCWTPGGRETGGSAQGLRVARACGVPVFNLALPGGLAWAMARLAGRQPGADSPGLGTGQLYFAF